MLQKTFREATGSGVQKYIKFSKLRLNFTPDRLKHHTSVACPAMLYMLYLWYILSCTVRVTKKVGQFYSDEMTG